MRTLLVFGERTFQIEVPDDAKITFGPWSPSPRSRTNPGGAEMFGAPSYNPTGTLRIYRGTKDNIVALFAGVTGFRDLSLSYREEVAREEGATIWKDDEHGYIREDKHSRKHEWIEPVIEAPKPSNNRKRRAKAAE